MPASLFSFLPDSHFLSSISRPATFTPVTVLPFPPGRFPTCAAGLPCRRRDTETSRNLTLPADIRHPGAQGPSSPSLIGCDSKYVPWNWLGTHERKCASTCCAARWREEWRRGGRTERESAWQRSRKKMKTWVQLGEQIWRCLTGFHTSVAYCRHYYNVAFGHFYRWQHCGEAEGKQRTDKKWLSWMSYGTEGGSLWIKLWSYSRFPLFIFLSKWKWLPLVSSCKRKVWQTFIWTYVRMVAVLPTTASCIFEGLPWMLDCFWNRPGV